MLILLVAMLVSVIPAQSGVAVPTLQNPTIAVTLPNLCAGLPALEAAAKDLTASTCVPPRVKSILLAILDKAISALSSHCG